MRKLITSTLLIISFLTIKAQQVDFDSLILPISIPSLDFQEYLVQVAWLNTPQNQQYKSNVNIAKTDVKIAKWDWANDAVFTVNLNENNIESFNRQEPAAEDTLALGNLNSLSAFPRYNFQIALNLGRLINRKRQVNKAKEKLIIEQSSLNQRKLEFRAEVLRRYLLHQNTIEILKVRQQAESDFQQTFKLIESRFKEGTNDFEEYSRASSSYQNAFEARLNAESELLQTKIDIEEIIGIPLELAKQYHQQAINRER